MDRFVINTVGPSVRKCNKRFAHSFIHPDSAIQNEPDPTLILEHAQMPLSTCTLGVQLNQNKMSSLTLYHL
jgi:hypothetical protein